MGFKDHVKQVNREQAHQIEKHKWLVSEQCKKDMSDTAILEWVGKYAASFREWAESIPYECIRCGLCPEFENREECCKPFDEERLKRIESKKG
jgi:hypothetical protein